ncbi:squalene/phytoene synthase family protein [Alphaproteobacteria bacterium]|nr:squalene/phytoene synthase family protein [Alphaproteobacteria bacterium]
MSFDAPTLRAELRGFDGDLYLTHLFAPAATRDHLLAIYHAYADMARIPHTVSEPMIGAIRLQWWRDLLSGLGEQQAGDSPIGSALLACKVDNDAFLAMINGREAELQLENQLDLMACSPIAQSLGGAFMALSLDMLGVEDPSVREVGEQAGQGFELLRLTAPGHERMAGAARAFLETACRRFNSLPRAQRKKALPAFLPIGLARYQSQHWPKQKSLLAYQWKILRMALWGRL